jgi:putative addiction module antidote
MNKPATFPKPLKLVAIGNSTGVVLPREMLARLGIARGDLVGVAETETGYELRPHQPDFEDQMTVAREVMLRRRAALRELAK